MNAEVEHVRKPLRDRGHLVIEGMLADKRHEAALVEHAMGHERRREGLQELLDVLLGLTLGGSSPESPAKCHGVNVIS